MPNFDYFCTACDMLAEDIQVSIADRDLATTQPCPNCDAEGTVQRAISAPGLGDPWRLGRVKQPKAFKDLLKHIGSKHLHNTINVDR